MLYLGVLQELQERRAHAARPAEHQHSLPRPDPRRLHGVHGRAGTVGECRGLDGVDVFGDLCRPLGVHRDVLRKTSDGEHSVGSHDPVAHLLFVDVFVDSRIQCIVLATEETTVTQNESAIDLSSVNPARGRKEVRRSTDRIMVTTRYYYSTNRDGSKPRQVILARSNHPRTSETYRRRDDVFWVDTTVSINYSHLEGCQYNFRI